MYLLSFSKGPWKFHWIPVVFSLIQCYCNAIVTPQWIANGIDNVFYCSGKEIGLKRKSGEFSSLLFSWGFVVKGLTTGRGINIELLMEYETFCCVLDCGNFQWIAVLGFFYGTCIATWISCNCHTNLHWITTWIAPRISTRIVTIIATGQAEELGITTGFDLALHL